MRHRVIPFLSIIDDNLVKTVKFKNPNYIGDPINALRIFNAKEVDELFIQDIRASETNSAPNFELIRDMASEAFMPIAYGGGISSMEHMERLFKNGVEKICMNSYALMHSEIVELAVSNFGSQSIAISLDIKKNFFGNGYSVFYKSAKKKYKLGLIDSLKFFQDQGVGEIIINSIDLDGSMAGVDSNLSKICSNSLSVPLIYVGGVGNPNDIKNSIESGSSATGVGSMFVYNGPRKAVLISYTNFDD